MRNRASKRSGESNNGARMTSDAVASLRADHVAGLSTADLATKYGVSKSQVRNITSGRHWKEAA